MKLSDFGYSLPKELIANSHIEPRDHSRLLVLDRSLGYTRDEQARSGQIEHKHFYDILDYLKKGDVLVFNNSKVFKARIFGSKKTGGKIEFLLVRPINDYIWEVLVKGRVKVGDRIMFDQVPENNPEVRPTGVPLARTSGRLGANVLEAEIVKKKERVCEVKFNASVGEVFQYLEKYGEIPLPPYIKKNQKSKIKNQNYRATSSQYLNPPKLKANEAKEADFYQTVYASKTGSVAAPTAGFHFTAELLDKLKKKGVECLEITLHVGPGTFLPVEAENIENHKMHGEFFEIDAKTWDKILQARKDGRRVIAVGTTTCRVLESMAQKYPISNIRYPINNLISNVQYQDKILGSTSIFIYPPYGFQIVDTLITNFHLPKSTLLMLVSAFADSEGLNGIETIKKAYTEAVDRKYRFYSFGDSMIIL